MSETLLADYMPETNEGYKMAKSLSYEVVLKSGVFSDTITIILFALLGFVGTGLLMGLDFDKLAFYNVASIVLILLPASVIGFLLWRLFRIWCMAPSMSEPPPEQCRISKSDDSLIVEVGASRLVASFDRVHYYLERDEYIAFQLGQFSTAMVVPKRAFCKNTIDQFRQILAENGVKANWWTLRKLLG
jgi:hypothetical protein